jgi:ABC-type multidrug transport system fused ATPase/permease subunit
VSERAVEMAIADMSGKITMLAITHRVTTLQSFDRIFVLDDGVIIAEGDYATLLRESPMFRRLVSHDATGTPLTGEAPDEISPQP